MCYGVYLLHARLEQKNAFLAPETWLWGYSDEYKPEDSVAGALEVACKAQSDNLQCRFASLGHPNQRGEGEYAKAIQNVL